MKKTEMMKKKAYVVRIDEDEGYCTVVFAENRNRAKLLAMSDDCFDSYTRYIDLRPTRIPQADFFVKENPNLHMLDMNNLEHARFLRGEGWFTADSTYCDECGLASFESVPESQVVEVDGEMVCLECLQEKEVENGKD